MKRLLALALVACSSPPAPAPVPPSPPAPAPAPVTPRPPEGPQVPTVAKRPHPIVSPNGTRDDPYFWLRDDTRKDKDVLAYLAAENAYAHEVLAPAAQLEATVLDEMKRRVAPADASAPVWQDGYWYQVRYAEGQEQPVHVRHKGKLDAPEEVVVDGNALAAGHAFFSMSPIEVSRDGKLVAWADDTVGRRQFTLHVKELATGKVLADTATNIAPNLAWANDNKTLFYVGKDPTTLRTDRVLRHTLGSTAADPTIFQEADGQYYVSIGPTKSHRYIEIALEATTNTEVRLLDADKPDKPDRVVLARERDHLYDLDHLDGKFVIRSNAGARNFRLISVPEAKVADRKAWKDLIPASDTLVQSFTLAHRFIAATVRDHGLAKVLVLPASGKQFFVDASEPAYAMGTVDLPDPDTRVLRYRYTSPITPGGSYDLDVATGKKTLVKQDPVPGYDPAQYAVEYSHAPAADGTQVPVSIVYKKTTPRDGSAPLLVYGYGSYGATSEPYFDQTKVSLLDRGWVYAIAHVRGGEELGRAWYEDGKLMHKTNTFTDFIAVTEYLVKAKYGAAGHVFALGASAGGLLMGAITNLRPDLYRGVVALVPFVDVVTTMLDESIPLTTNEFDEWGNPKEKGAYDYMLSYSPYDNVKPQAYPAVYVRTGLWDSQVQYYEPAKWVAKLQAATTDRDPILLETDMAAGHGGKSGRFDRLRDVARYTAFVLYVDSRPDLRYSK